MVIREQDRTVARHMYIVAVGIIEKNDGDVAALARQALDRPAPDTIRALMDAGRGRPWLPMLVDALAQVGIAAAEDVLGERSILELTDSELDVVADSSIPEQLRWDSTDLNDLDLTRDDLTAEIKLERALRRAESAELRHGTRVVAMPGVLDGQPLVKWTRLTVSRLILELAVASEWELSREYSLPPEWLPAIVKWVYGQRAGGDDDTQ